MTFRVNAAGGVPPLTAGCVVRGASTVEEQRMSTYAVLHGLANTRPPPHRQRKIASSSRSKVMHPESARSLLTPPCRDTAAAPRALQMLSHRHALAQHVRKSSRYSDRSKLLGRRTINYGLLTSTCGCATLHHVFTWLHARCIAAASPQRVRAANRLAFQQ